MHFQTTHKHYGWVEDKNSISNINPAGINFDNPDLGNPKLGKNKNNQFIYATWYGLQKLKSIFYYMKNLPCDRQNDGIDNQYENTNIYVVSNHGNGLRGRKSDFFKIQNICFTIMNLQVWLLSFTTT